MSGSVLETGARMQTFVVRLWVEPTGKNGTSALRRGVEHFGSGGSTTFTDDAELLAFLHEATGRVGPAGDAP